MQEADWAKVTADAAAELCGIALISVGVDLENPRICFRTSFEKDGDGYRCCRELQPDGRYWEDDDGFGAKRDSELILYADMDENGDFVTPFQINRINGNECNGFQSAQRYSL